MILKNKTIPGEEGFTLIEVMVATVILTFLTFGIVKMTDNSILTKERVTAEDQEALRIEMGIARIEEDLASLYTPLFFAAKAEAAPLEEEAFSRYEGGEKFAFTSTLGHPVPFIISADKTTLEFMVYNNRRRVEDSKQSTFAWVRYSLRKWERKEGDDDEAASGSGSSNKELLELVRAQSAEDPFSLEKIDWEKVKAYPVLSRITAFEFNFWDEKSKKFLESLTEVENGKQLLRAFKIKFTWMNKQGVELEESKIIRTNWPYFKAKAKKDPNSSSTSSGFGGAIDGSDPLKDFGNDPSGIFKDGGSDGDE
ncbi:MAG: prepilin-type N-terminal cleavage/methylation domain-containing protein [Oligoflexia bacterium]|nr:prepilin-type N-terminal cleavage/methylation domain-containing protein [Oligoflexia bacterium]MBF0364482.1 prepilin-type N-terminal cleavage/methylation domain-containing protein [Oligoflexia bacterium]